MCRQYSAETEDALKGLMRWENDPIPGIRDNAERIVLGTLLKDPYQLEVVRRAIRFYLYHDAEAREEAFLDRHPDLRAFRDALSSTRPTTPTPDHEARNA